MEHEGIVASMRGDTMIVRIAVSSACSGCAAKSYCVPSENKDKDILVKGFSGDFVSGERVKVVMRQSLGLKALCIGYLIPLVIVLATLLTVFQTTGNELASGLSALLMLVPYYLIIKLLNQKITQFFRFTVQKINVA